MRSAGKIVGRFPTARAAALAFDFTTISRHYGALQSAQAPPPKTEAPKMEAGQNAAPDGGGCGVGEDEQRAVRAGSREDTLPTNVELELNRSTLPAFEKLSNIGTT